MLPPMLATILGTSSFKNKSKSIPPPQLLHTTSIDCIKESFFSISKQNDEFFLLDKEKLNKTFLKSIQYNNGTIKERISLLQSFVEQNELSKANELYQHLVLDNGYSSNKYARRQIFALFRALIDENRIHDAYNIILLTYHDRGWNNNYKLRVHMYYDVLKESSYSKRDFQLSQEIFTEMEKRGDAQNLLPNEATAIYSLMLRIMFMAGSSSSAQDLYTKLAARGNVKNSSEMYVAMIKGLARCGQLDRAEALFRDAVVEAEKWKDNGEHLNQHRSDREGYSLEGVESDKLVPSSKNTNLFADDGGGGTTTNDDGDDDDALLTDTMFDDNEDSFDWVPEHINYTGRIKFYNKSRGFGTVTLKNNSNIFIHSNRSFGKSNPKGYWKKKHLQNTFKILEQNPGIQVEFGIEDGKKGKEARHLNIIGHHHIDKNNMKTKIVEHQHDYSTYGQNISSFSLKETYHAMIETYARFQHIDKAEWLFDEMKKQMDELPDIKTYDVMIHALSIAELNVKKKEQKRMKEKENGMAEKSTNAPLRTFLRRAKTLFYEITEYKHDKHLYATMIRALIDHNEIDLADEIYQDMLTLGYENDSIYIVSSLIVGNGKMNKINKSIEIYNNYMNYYRLNDGDDEEENRNNKKNKKSILISLNNALLHAYTFNNMVNESMELFNKMIYKDVKTYDIIIRGLLNTSKIYHSNDGRKKKYIKLGCELYKRNGLSDQLRNDHYINNLLLNSVCSINTKWSSKTSMQLMDEMEYRGVLLDDTTISSMITLMSKRHNLSKAMSIYNNTIPRTSFSSKTSSSSSPNNKIQNVFSDLTNDDYINSNREHLNSGTPRTLRVYNAILESLSRANKIKLINAIQNEMKSLNIKSNNFTIMISLHAKIKQFLKNKKISFNDYSNITNDVRLLLKHDDTCIPGILNSSNERISRHGGNHHQLTINDFQMMLIFYVNVIDQILQKDHAYNMLLEVWNRSKNLNIDVNLSNRVMNVIRKYQNNARKNN